jgi:hypothetical protein
LKAYVENPENSPVSLNVAISGNPASTPLQIDLSAALNDGTTADGIYAVTVELADKNTSPKTNSYGPFVFGIDAFAPTIAVTVPAKARDYVSTDFTLKGTVTTRIGIKTLKVTLPPGSSPVETILTYTGIDSSFPAVNGSMYTWEIPTLTLLPDAGGEQNITIEATDKFGLPNSLPLIVIRDNTPPTVESILYPSVSNEAAVTITGVAEDHYAAPPSSSNAGDVAKVLYWIGNELSAPDSLLPYDKTLSGNDLYLWLIDDSRGTDKWLEASGTTRWSAQANLTGEGKKSFYVIVFDAAWNSTLDGAGLAYTISGANQKADFWYDKAAPVLALDSSIPGRTNASYSISGKITETNALDPAAPLNIRQERRESPNGPIVETTNIVAPPGSLTLLPSPEPEGTYSFNLEGFPRKHSAPNVDNDPALGLDGQYTYTFTVTDIVGKTNSGGAASTCAVYYDTTGPAVTIANPAPPEADGTQAFVGSKKLVISGASNDPNSLSNINAVLYRVTGTAAPAPSLPYTANPGL